MKFIRINVFFFVLFFTVSGIVHSKEMHEEQVRFKPGDTSTVINGKIKGSQFVDYRISAKAGQTLTISLKTINRSNYFNVMAPNEESAIFIGSTSGNDFSATLPIDGDYTARVYLMPSAGRRDEKANFSIKIVISDNH